MSGGGSKSVAGRNSCPPVRPRFCWGIRGPVQLLTLSESEPEQPIVVTAMAGSGDEARADAQPGPLASIVVSATPVNEHNPELASVESEPEQPIIVTAMAGSGDEARADAQPGALASIVVATPVYERNPELAFVPVVQSQGNTV